MSRRAAPARPGSFRSVSGAVGAVVAGALLLLGVAGVRSWRDLAAARAREAALVRDIEEAEERIARLHARIERLKTDPSTLERLAREELGMVLPGDVVIVLPPDATPPVRKPSPPEPGANAFAPRHAPASP